MGNIAGAANNFGVGALSPMALGMGMVPLLRLGGLSGVVSGVSDLNEGHSFGHAGLSALSSAGGAIGGSMVGRWIGGMLGSAGGPAGAIVGSMIGGYAADKLIDMLWTEAPEQENLKLHGAKKAEESNQKVFVQLDAIHKSTQDTVVAINNLTKAFKDTPVQKIRDTAHQVVMVSARTP
jgi:phage tail tape-measure protein